MARNKGDTLFLALGQLNFGWRDPGIGKTDKPTNR
jgi:hypothetical protein